MTTPTDDMMMSTPYFPLDISPFVYPRQLSFPDFCSSLSGDASVRTELFFLFVSFPFGSALFCTALAIKWSNIVLFGLLV